jgi:hypothetical protein
MALGVVHLFEIRVVGYFNPFLQRNHLVVAGHSGHGVELLTIDSKIRLLQEQIH